MNNIYKSKYFYLLLALFLYFFSTSILSHYHFSGIFLSILFTVFIVYCLFSLTTNRFMVILVFISGAITLLFHWLISIKYTTDTNLHISFYTFDIIFQISIIYSVISSIVNDKKITFDTLFGAICSYLLIGFMWGLIYLLINTINPAAFSEQLISGTIHENLKHAFYYSFTTLTTLGYGDILPRSDIARTASWVEAVVGQIYLVVWISELVGKRIMQFNNIDKINTHS